MDKKKSPAWAYDVRVSARNVADGSISQKDYENHLTTLPDVASKAEPFDTTLAGDRDIDDEDDADEG
jgi:hypothetical protein